MAMVYGLHVVFALSRLDDAVKLPFQGHCGILPPRRIVGVVHVTIVEQPSQNDFTLQ